MKLIEKSIKPEKAKAWHYKVHPYFTKQSHNVVKAYVENFTKKGDVVLDPFSGSGVTGLVALELGRKAFLSDLNPFAVFIGKQTAKLSKVDLVTFGNEYVKIEENIKESVKFIRTSSEKEIEDYKITEWYPTDIKMPSNSDFKNFKELFDKRQLIVLAKLYQLILEIQDEDIQGVLKLIFSTTLNATNKTFMKNTKGSGGGASSVMKLYRYYRAKNHKYLDVFEIFEARMKIMKRAIDKVQGLNFNLDDFQIYHTSATNLDYLENQSIDYIYTDPPYGKKITYLDLSTIFNAWLN